jgi:hypothetical protein
MIRLLLLIGVAAILFIFFRWLFRQPPKIYWQWIVIVVAIGLLLMVATGRAHWLTAVFAAMLPFLRAILALLSNVPLLKRVLDSFRVAQSAAPPSGGQTSSVQSRYIRMTLAHDTGDVNGEVLEGQFKGQELNQMSLEELLQLLRECQDDEESVALLQAYLDRVYEDEWQQQAGTYGQQQTTSGSGEVSREEALQILGLSSDPSEEEIIKAHRLLIQKLHPDRGGSAYLAAKINQAKETLLSN